MRKIALLMIMAFALKANAQILKNNLLSGYKEGDKLEKKAYSEPKEPINQDTWCEAYTSNPISGVNSPLIGKELSYPGYKEKGASIQFGGFPEGTKGTRSSIYSLDQGKKYSSGTLYLSCLVNFSKLGSSGLAEMLSLSASYSGVSSRGSVFVAREGGDKIRFAVGLYKQRTEAPMAYDYDKTHLVVLKLDYSKNEAYLFINPDLGGAEPQPDAVANAGEDILKHAIRGISVRNRSGYVGNTGNFRLSGNWAGVTAQ